MVQRIYKYKMNNSDGNGNKTILGTTSSLPSASVLSMADFRQKKNPNQQWPSAVSANPPLPPQQVSLEDLKERRILMTLADGDVVMDGFIGLTQSFLAIGDKHGSIKFAAAPGVWRYVLDVTDDPAYADVDKETEPTDAA